jgi:hypothetical protein
MATSTNTTTTIEREPQPERTKRGRGAGAKLDLSIYYYKAPDGTGPDFGTFAGKDEDGRWELHFANEDELDSQLGRIVAVLDGVATEAREDADERAAGTTVWLKAIGAVGASITENWWEGERDREGGVDFPYRPRAIKDGDLLVIYGATTGMVVGVMRMKGEWYEGGETDRWKYRMDGEIIARRPVSEGVPLESISDEREITKSIRQKSHIRLSSAEAETALSAFGVSSES